MFFQTESPVLNQETDEHYTVAQSNQRKVAYASGRFWVFYCYYDVDLYEYIIAYRSSADGSSWTDPTTIGYLLNGSIDFDMDVRGTTIDYARFYTTGYPNRGIYYRRGTLNADGTITWAAAEQTVTETETDLQAVHIVVDSSEYPYIVTDYAYASAVKCYRSSKNDGTWTTLSVDTVFSSNNHTCDALRYGSYLMVITARTGTYFQSKTWNGSTWSDAATGIGKIEAGYFDAVADGTTVHLVYGEQQTYPDMHLYYEKYSAGSWGSRTLLEDNSDYYQWNAPALTVDGNDLYVFWASSDWPTYNNKIYLIRYTGSWQSREDAWSDDDLARSYFEINSFDNPNEDQTFALLYVNTVGSDFQLKLALSSVWLPTVKVKGTSFLYTLDVVATGASGMGGIPRFAYLDETKLIPTNWDITLVETADAAASPVRIKTTTGVKAFRYKSKA
jgi:hypothetical protein